MVRQNPNVTRLMERLDATMEVLDGKIQEGTARSNANYLSFFEDKSEELYRLHYMYKCLNDRKRLSKYIFYSSFSLLTFATKK